MAIECSTYIVEFSWEGIMQIISDIVTHAGDKIIILTIGLK